MLMVFISEGFDSPYSIFKTSFPIYILFLLIFYFYLLIFLFFYSCLHLTTVLPIHHIIHSAINKGGGFLQQ